ncbi:MAG: hypothetical protein ACFHXK_05205 [bacterium]
MQKSVLTKSVLMFFCLGSISGCVSYSTSQLASKDPFPNQSTLSHVHAGATDSAWLIEHFGYPASIISTAPDTEQWQYHRHIDHTTEVRAFPLLAVNLARTEVRVYHFELVADKVKRHWQETAD